MTKQEFTTETDGEEYADVRFRGNPVAWADLIERDGRRLLQVCVADPNQPDDVLAEFEFGVDEE